MKRFLVAAAVAVSLGFVSSGKADAQISYGYTVPANGGILSSQSFYVPGAVKTYNSFYNPYFGTVQNQVYSSNMFGQTYSRGYGYNPWNGAGYNYRLYQPNWFTAPYGSYNYGYGFRRW